MIKTYTYKIKTNKEFERKFNQWSGICRFVYNCALECKITAYKMSGVVLSGYDLNNQLTKAKKEITWLNIVSAQTLQGINENVNKSFKDFFRRGYGFPKFKSKKRDKSILFKKVRYRWGKFCMDKWGEVKVFKNRLPEGKLKTASIVKKADGYYLHVTAEAEQHKCTSENQVGIDMGISKLAVTSEGYIIENPKLLQRYEKKLRIEQRALARKKLYSSNWYKQVNKLSRLYLKISRVRLDYLHKETTKLSKQYGTIFMEKLNTQGMVKSNYGKAIFDCSWYKFKELLSYKSNVILVNPKYTSQTCSNCNHRDKDNRLSQSKFKCTNCNLELNADYNASINILGLGKAFIREREEMLSCA